MTAQVAADTRSVRELPLRPYASAPQQAREFVAETFAAWRLETCTEPAVLITSELVTNAVRHARTELTVRIRRAASEVRIEVADRDGDRQPRAEPGDPRRVGGVGLVIVERLAQEWGVERLQDGKAVWAKLTVDLGLGAVPDVGFGDGSGPGPGSGSGSSPDSGSSSDSDSGFSSDSGFNTRLGVGSGSLSGSGSGSSFGTTLVASLGADSGPISDPSLSPSLSPNPGPALANGDGAQSAPL